MGDPVTLYLKRRGIGGMWPLPACLRYHQALPYWDDGEVLGTFGIYYRTVKLPTDDDIALVTEFTRLAGLAVQFSAATIS